MTVNETSKLFDLEKDAKARGGFKAGDLLAVEPKIFDKMLKHQARTVKRDWVTKNMITLTGVSAYTPDPINLFLRGESSIGKTYNTTEGLKYFPPEDVWMLGGLSPTALIHGYGDLVDEHGNLILFDQKPDRSASAEEKEAWREKLRNSKYIVDLRGKILAFLEAPHRRTYQMLRPILSHDKFEISYKITDPEKLKTKHIVIRGWPATIFCSTEERYIADLVTRGFTITPETESEKYEEANKLTGTRKAYPWAFNTSEDRDFFQLQGYIEFLRGKLKDVTVLVPYAPQLAEKFPSMYARSMRDYKHLLSLIEVYTCFHLYQRPVLIRKLKDESQNIYVIATREDYGYIFDLWNKIEETTVTGLPGHILKFYENAVKPVAEYAYGFTVKDLTDKYNEKSEVRKSSDSIRKWVDLLCQIGWLTKNPDPNDKRKNIINVIRNSEKNGNHTKIAFSEFFDLESLKEWLNTAKKISEENSIVLRDSLISETKQGVEADLDAVWFRYYQKPLGTNADSSNIEIEPKQDAKDETTEENSEKRKGVQFPVFAGKDTTEPMGPTRLSDKGKQQLEQLQKLRFKPKDEQREPEITIEPFRPHDVASGPARIRNPYKGNCDGQCRRKGVIIYHKISTYEGKTFVLCEDCAVAIKEQKRREAQE